MFGRWGCWCRGLSLALAVLATVPASAETAAEADKLNAEVIRLFNAGKYSEAVPIAERAVALTSERLGDRHPDHATAIIWLAGLYRALGRYSEAEPLYLRALAVRENALGPDHAEVGQSLNSLGLLRWHQGRYAEAELTYRRALAVREKALGPDHADVRQSLNNIGLVYWHQGRYAEAELTYRRALAVREKALGPDHADVGQSLNNLGLLHWDQGRYRDAEPMYQRALAIREKALGSDHPDVAQSLNNLGLLYQDQRRYSDAEPLLSRALANRERSLGSDHPDVGQSLNNLGLLYQRQRRYGEAEPLHRRALAVRERALGPDHTDVGQSLRNLAWLALDYNDYTAAAQLWSSASDLLIRRAVRGLGGVSEGSSRGEAQRSSRYFEGLIKSTYRQTGTSEERTQRASAMFEKAQWIQGSEAATSVAQMAARSAGVSSELATIVRERQDLVAEWQGKDKQLIIARSETPDKRNAAAERELSNRLAAIDLRLSAIDKYLAKHFPDYAALASPKPASIADVQASLRDDEALLLFLDTDSHFRPLPEETFVWVVTKNNVRWMRSDIGSETLWGEVGALRCGLDAAAWWNEYPICPNLTGSEYSKADHDARKPLPFDAIRAHALYKGLLGDAADLIKGKHLLVVLSGELTTIPLQLLVTRPPKSGDLKSVRWLARDHAITVLPSVASLKALRRTGKPSAAPNPLIGFGNPLLDGDQAHPQHGAYFKKQAQVARAQSGCAKSPQRRTASLRVVARSLSPLPVSGRTADLNHLRMQAPLPETADELCEVARSVGGNVEHVRIGSRATETEVKRLSSSGDLAKYRILHFATHGTLAGQLKGTSEPGLILTPPKTAADEDDGYLSGSEIASLKLDADWVILSACNTAGGAGEGEAAEALSGLARVFFYAGARALLVSHWEVDSAATVKLITTAMAELAKDKSIGRAEAMRRAMLAVMADTSRPANWVPAWHPSVWAPFVVVGEGGLGR